MIRFLNTAILAALLAITGCEGQENGKDEARAQMPSSGIRVDGIDFMTPPARQAYCNAGDECQIPIPESLTKVIVDPLSGETQLVFAATSEPILWERGYFSYSSNANVPPSWIADASGPYMLALSTRPQRFAMILHYPLPAEEVAFMQPWETGVFVVQGPRQSEAARFMGVVLVNNTPVAYVKQLALNKAFRCHIVIEDLEALIDQDIERIGFLAESDPFSGTRMFPENKAMCQTQIPARGIGSVLPLQSNVAGYLMPAMDDCAVSVAEWLLEPNPIPNGFAESGILEVVSGFETAVACDWGKQR